MPYYIIALGIVAGICQAFGILYLFIGLRRQDHKPLNLTFALFALAYAGTLLNGVLFHSTTSLAEFLFFTRWDAIFVVMAFTSLIWFVAFYTGVRPPIFLWGLTAAFTLPGIANIVRPNLIHDEIFGLLYITLPWGEQLTEIDATDTIWADIFLLAQLLTIGFIFFAFFRQYRRGERQAALLLGVGMLWFIATIVYEILGESGVTAYFPFGEFGFLGIAIVMVLQMTNSVIKIEGELAYHRRNLEDLVETRTTELSRSNDQLVQEIEERKRVEQALNRRVEELAILHQTAHIVATVSDLPAALNEICEILVYLSNARFVHIILAAGAENELMVNAGFEAGAGPIEGQLVPVTLTEMPWIGQMLDRTESLVVTDLLAQPLPVSVREVVARLNLQSGMLVPLVIRGVAIGFVSITTDQVGRGFSTEEVNLVETIAADIAAAIENADLLEETKEAAAVKERNRIARELHDSVTQTMYSVSIVAEAMPRVLERDLAEAKRNAAYLRQTTLGALAELRMLLFELRPDNLLKSRLKTLLQQLADALTGRSRIPVQLTLEGETDLPPEVKVTLYRIVQEALNNIARHSQATRAWITLQKKPEQVTLAIGDNGLGFDPSQISEERLGLRIMRERAEAIGASFMVNSRPGQGTQLSIIWTPPAVDNPAGEETE